MARYIDADKADVNEISVYCNPDDVQEWLNAQPTADVAEVKHGEWKHTDKARYWAGKDECSECTYHYYDRRDLSHFNYCPDCGAKMDGGKI